MIRHQASASMDPDGRDSKQCKAESTVHDGGRLLQHTDPILQLPTEIITRIGTFLQPRGLARARCTCKLLRDALTWNVKEILIPLGLEVGQQLV